MDGYLLVGKPLGISSFGVVARVRRIISDAKGKKVKIGHCGTLDPAASGLMILVIGKYTKKASEFSKLDKTYIAEITLGLESSTGDREGELTRINDKIPSIQEVQAVLDGFVGEISQVPPAFSAVKVDGQRAYKLARAGKMPELKPRQVTVHRLQVTDYKYPKLRFTTEVSSGTYIRSLAEDIGQKLGTGAYLSALHRIKVGNFDIKDALTLEKLNISELETGVVKE
ncbi:MAG: tRNA pseudouridine(55) synthase TruB [Patescibacteria group bacterium]